jgi:glycosyltransferase involved in cell wall biosynthesis
VTSPSVLVDATAIPGDRGGVGRYLEHLLPALEAYGTRLTIVAKKSDAGWLADSVPGATVVVPRASIDSRARRLVWEQAGLPRLAARHSADVIFSPHYTMPLASRLPVVVTLHDATFFSNPELHSRGKRVFFRTWIRRSLTSAAALIAPSAATRAEVARWTGLPVDKVTVAFHGVDAATFHAPSRTETDAARALVGGDDWIAFLGTLEPRKNLVALVEAFATVAARLADRFPDLRLVLAGGKGWDDRLDAAIARSPVRDRIVRLGFVPNSALPGILGSSLAVAYPSLGEGFGLPVLEAMACGAPVVTTRLLALPEVGGDVAVYTEPDAASIAGTLVTLLGDDADRADRAKRGLARAAEFGWAASAQTHAAVFEKAAFDNAALDRAASSGRKTQ